MKTPRSIIMNCPVESCGNTLRPRVADAVLSNLEEGVWTVHVDCPRCGPVAQSFDMSIPSHANRVGLLAEAGTPFHWRILSNQSRGDAV